MRDLLEDFWLLSDDQKSSLNDQMAEDICHSDYVQEVEVAGVECYFNFKSSLISADIAEINELVREKHIYRLIKR